MDNDLEQRAEQRVRARSGFVIHLAMYLTVNAGLVLIWFLTGRGYPWFLWPMIGWGIGIVAHALSLAIGPGSEGERRAIEREVRRLREAGGPP